ESDGHILNDHQRFVSLFERHLLPSSFEAIPRTETPNDQPLVPPLSGVLPNTEAPNDHPHVPSISGALPSAEISHEHDRIIFIYIFTSNSLVMTEYDDRLREAERYKAKLKENM
ncbi:hypothetical protein DVH24_008011, partial [Malus domestica]